MTYLDDIPLSVIENRLATATGELCECGGMDAEDERCCDACWLWGFVIGTTDNPVPPSARKWE